MGKPKTDLAPRIREKTLKLLMEKDPGEISTRDIAKICGATTTCIYYYYKDKETLFMEIKLDCVEKMDAFIINQAKKMIFKHQKANKKVDPLLELRAGLEAFRDWAFKNPGIAMLIMERLKADTLADSEKMKKYYKSTIFAKTLLDNAVKAGISNSKDTLLDASLCISALWGAIESVLQNRTIPKYWTQQGKVIFTNKMIDLLLASLTRR